MSVRGNATAVGAFVLGALAIAIGIAVVFGSGLLFRERHALCDLLRRLARGSEVGAPVKFRGVQIGQVVSITAVYRGQAARPWTSRSWSRSGKDAVQAAEDGGGTLQAA